MELDAIVARTAYDLDHVNRIGIPGFGLLKLYLQVDGGAPATSKCYLPDDAPAIEGGNSGTDLFHFAPENETVKICYEIEDPFGLIDQAKLELYARYRDQPLWSLDLVPLGLDWYRHGKHSIAWDGRLPGQPDAQKAGVEADDGISHTLLDYQAAALMNVFPDGYVTLQFTPYKFRMTIGSSGTYKGNALTGWTYFQILAQKIELEYGTKDMLPDPVVDKGDHRKVLDALIAQNAKPPAENAANPVKVYLESDLYKTNADQMFDNSLFTAYQTLWDNGPMIPLLAKIWIQNSKGQDALSPKALGKVKFLWDWESLRDAGANTFVQQAQNYHKDATKPKGQNCHFDRSGKRGDGAQPVFPPQAGYDPKDVLDNAVFPFTVEACPDPRKWAAYSYAWRDKLLANKTGVIFQPSRMAGDCYKVTVYLAWDEKEAGKPRLNVDDDAPLPAHQKIKAVSGKFEVWRKTHFRKFIRKRAAGMPAVDIPTITGCYDRAFMQIDNDTGGAQDISEGDWNTAVTNAVTGWDRFKKFHIDNATNQYTAGAAGMYFRTRADYMKTWVFTDSKSRLLARGVDPAHVDAIAHAGESAGSAAAAGNLAKNAGVLAGYNSVPWQTAISDEVSAKWTTVHDWMDNPANARHTPAAYALVLQNYAVTILTSIFNALFAADPGVHLFQVDKSHSQTGLQTSMTIGQALDFGNANLNKCGFLLMCPAGVVACGLDKISAHEIGHHFFLPHPIGTAENCNYYAHDQAVNSCLMTYNYASAMELCGFCQLRLRGWEKKYSIYTSATVGNANGLDPDGPTNSAA